jgi:hypothetical protein
VEKVFPLFLSLPTNERAFLANHHWQPAEHSKNKVTTDEDDPVTHATWAYQGKAATHAYIHTNGAQFKAPQGKKMSIFHMHEKELQHRAQVTFTVPVR